MNETIAPYLVLPTAENKEVSLLDFKGNPVWVSFLSHAA